MFLVTAGISADIESIGRVRQGNSFPVRPVSLPHTRLVDTLEVILSDAILALLPRPEIDSLGMAL